MYDSTLNQDFLVHMVDGTTQVFRSSRKGLFFSDVINDMGHSYINTLDSNKSQYTIKYCSDAVHTCSLQDIIGWPSTSDYRKHIETGMIPNCPITKAVILHVEDIFGANIGSLQGKKTRKKTSPINTVMEELTTGMLEPHGNVTLEVDVMYINEFPFVMTVSWSLHFGTAELIKNEQATTIASSIKHRLQIYHRCKNGNIINDYNETETVNSEITGLYGHAAWTT